MKPIRNLVIAAVLIANLALVAGAANAQNDLSPQVITHVVQRGENLFRIALRYNVSVAQLRQWNNIANANLIFAGQTLYVYGGQQQPAPVPVGKSYTVQSGDTLGRIARSYGVDLTVLARVNNIANVNFIYVGQKLTIPDFTIQ